MFDNARKIHLIGIGGYGMSALAKLLLEMGYTVSGSDLTPSDITKHLTEMGAEISFGHSVENVEGRDLIVYSTAIPSENDELQAARQQGNLFHRSEILARFLNSHKGIAISGAHGKTTTTTMLTEIMERGQLDPTALIGGEVGSFSGTARLGRGDYVVAEADESDQSFSRYQPWAAIITNIEPDHLEHYNGSFEKLLAGYSQFLSNISAEGFAVVPDSDQWINQVLSGVRCPIVTYGQERGDYSARNINLLARGSEFELWHQDQLLTRIQLKVPGVHNILNATAAAAAAVELDIGAEIIQKALLTFQGAKRRFQILAEQPFLIIDDYAHHPTEVVAALKAARGAATGRLLAVFQPHRYSRTQYFMQEFTRAFDDADIVIVDDIYAASEQPLPGVSSRDLVALMSCHHHGEVRHISGLDKIIQYLSTNLCPGDTVITMGAGDISHVGHGLSQNSNPKVAGIGAILVE